jgi:hypothetical protein
MNYKSCQQKGSEKTAVSWFLRVASRQSFHIFSLSTSVLTLHRAGIVTVRWGWPVLTSLITAQVHAGETQVLSKKTNETVKHVKSKNLKKKPAAKPKREQTDTVELEEIQVSGRAKNLIGLADSASQGEVSQAQFEHRPLSRVGELVEIVPGVIATQHSGSGKANQYFLRGYNLDHGTDFTTYVDGIPMNMASHAHGQGYLRQDVYDAFIAKRNFEVYRRFI